MGNILSPCCLPGDKNLDDSVNERTRILSDPAEGRMSNDEGGQSSDFGNGKDVPTYGTMQNGSKNDKSNAWLKTMNKMANNVIDVSIIDMAPMEHNETHERSRVYTNRINQLKNPILLKFRLQSKSNKINTSKRLDSNEYHKMNGINQEDINLISSTLDESIAAIKKGFVILIQDDLVVQFNP